ncbi:MAG: YeeE/YedE family protein [Anaerolinea sp.]|nr:YeeE/YedE family protein [Anaerolinea sp.]
MNPLVYTGLALGILFGFALQRGRFCMNSAFRDILVLKDYDLIKSVGVAVLLGMAGFAIMGMAGIVQLNPKPLLWGANILGGLVFGMGMVLAGGCASGITYRAGEGMVGAMAAIGGFSLAALMAAMGVFKPFVSSLQESTKITMADGSAPTLANIFGLPQYVMALGIVIVATGLWIYLARRNKEEDDYGYDDPATLGERIFKRGWGWLASGLAIGVISIIAFPLSAAAGRNYPLGITGGWVAIFKSLVTGENAMSWEAFLVLGVVIGAVIAALIAGEIGLRAPAPKMLVQTFGGGLLMGFGAVCASGCNVGHILSGVPQLSIGSIVGGISIVLGAWFMAYLMFIRPQRVKAQQERAAHAHA